MLGAFPSSRALTPDGRVAIVPLPGHSPGHLGLVVRTTEGDIVFGGDAAFSADQVATRTLAGIVEEPAMAARTLDVLARHAGATRSFLLFAHDLAGVARFLADEPWSALRAASCPSSSPRRTRAASSLLRWVRDRARWQSSIASASPGAARPTGSTCTPRTARARPSGWWAATARRTWCSSRRARSQRDRLLPAPGRSEEPPPDRSLDDPGDRRGDHQRRQELPPGLVRPAQAGPKRAIAARSSRGEGSPAFAKARASAAGDA